MATTADDTGLIDDAPDKKKKKKGGLKRMLVPLIGGALLLGGGVGAGVYAGSSGLLGGGAAEAEHGEAESDKPKLVPKGEHVEAPHGEGKEGAEESEAATTAKAHANDSGAPVPEHKGGSKYEATYYPIEQSFTANLRDSDALVQLSLGVATNYDAKVIENLERHAMPIRSAILMTLSDEDPVAITTPAGRQALQKHLTQAINRVLREKEGFGGIDDVYFTSFIVQ